MVLVSHKKEFVFLKTRKTAGTSTEMLLETFCAPSGHAVSEATPAVVGCSGIIGRRLYESPLNLPDPESRQVQDWYNHMPAREVAQRLGPTIWSRYTKVSCVRNPFDRTVSMFHWRLQWGKIEPEPDDLPRLFRAFVETDWPDDREVVMIDDKIVVDEFIRYESLYKDLAALAEKLALDIELSKLPHTKNLKEKRTFYSFAELYDRRSIDIVRDRLRWVFDHFGYPDEPA